jgi:hypothetical protein
MLRLINIIVLIWIGHHLAIGLSPLLPASLQEDPDGLFAFFDLSLIIAGTIVTAIAMI